MDRNPNSNLEPEENGETAQTGSAGEAFYNVMPQDLEGPQVISEAQSAPVSQAAASEPVPVAPEEQHQFNLPHSNRKMFMILGIIAALAIFGVFGFFGYRYAQQQKNTDPEPIANQEPEEEEEEPEVKSGVTTPPEWQKRYFSSEECLDMNVCADTADPDRDGLSNLEEYEKKTDPNNADSDADGLADGDEVHVFGGSPLTNRTNSSEEYLDSDYVKGGYDIATNVKFSETQLKDIIGKIKDKGLHQPTIKTLGAEYLKQYDFVDPGAGTTGGDSSLIDSSIDQSPTAKLARDTTRSDAIQKVASGLLKYKTAKGQFPDTDNYNEMVTAVKPYISVATKFEDPINQDKYVYGYIATAGNQDFTLLYYSETQNIVIKYTAQQAELDAIKANASANDDKRRRDVENIAFALNLYSDGHVDIGGTQSRVYPPNDYYKSELVPKYMTELPKDPRTGADYVYDVGDTFDTFTLKAVFDNPPKGMTGYVCNQEECKNY